MVIDTSALIAILLNEAEADGFKTLIAESDACAICSVTHVEAAIVALARLGPSGRDALAALIGGMEIEIAPFDGRTAEIAIEAFERFGEGRHPAALNFGDCCAYALAKSSAMPLLFKGEDFRRTDVASAAA